MIKIWKDNHGVETDSEVTIQDNISNLLSWLQIGEKVNIDFTDEKKLGKFDIKETVGKKEFIIRAWYEGECLDGFYFGTNEEEIANWIMNSRYLSCKGKIDIEVERTK